MVSAGKIQAGEERDQEQTAAVGERGGLGPCPGAEFAENAGDVGADHAAADEERRGDLGVGQTVGQQANTSASRIVSSGTSSAAIAPRAAAEAGGAGLPATGVTRPASTIASSSERARPTVNSSVSAASPRSARARATVCSIKGCVRAPDRHRYPLAHRFEGAGESGGARNVPAFERNVHQTGQGQRQVPAVAEVRE